MSLKQVLDARQSLTMTQNMQESLKILQLSAMDLSSYIITHLDSNPLLEYENCDEDNKIDHLEEDDYSLDSYISKAMYDDLYQGNVTSKTSWDNDYNRNSSTNKSLKQFVLEQMPAIIYEQKQQFIALYLIDLLDDSGYITFNEEAVSKHLNCNIHDISKTLKLLQQLEPCGIFARTLAECLELQLIEKKLLNKELSIIIKNLELVAAGKIEYLAKTYKFTILQIKNAMAIIQSLNPKPGSLFDNSNVASLIPDIILKIENGVFSLETNQQLTPKVSINKSYYQEVRSSAKNIEQKKYLTNCYNNANILVNALAQRNQSLYRVAEFIVKKQYEFFTKGINYLKSLSLKEIASELNLSTSTISRVIVNKHMATPLGVFELKYFLSAKIPNSDEDEGSNKQVKNLIKKIIANENDKLILSDSDIVTILQENAINISRRTVAKYRQQLGIASSMDRNKKLKMKNIYKIEC